LEREAALNFAVRRLWMKVCVDGSAQRMRFDELCEGKLNVQELAQVSPPAREFEETRGFEGVVKAVGRRIADEQAKKLAEQIISYLRCDTDPATGEPYRMPPPTETRHALGEFARARSARSARSARASLSGSFGRQNVVRHHPQRGQRSEAPV
jgi:hypothetical protein